MKLRQRERDIKKVLEGFTLTVTEIREDIKIQLGRKYSVSQLYAMLNRMYRENKVLITYEEGTDRRKRDVTFYSLNYAKETP